MKTIKKFDVLLKDENIHNYRTQKKNLKRFSSDDLNSISEDYFNALENNANVLENKSSETTFFMKILKLHPIINIITDVSQMNPRHPR